MTTLEEIQQKILDYSDEQTSPIQAALEENLALLSNSQAALEEKQALLAASELEFRNLVAQFGDIRTSLDAYISMFGPLTETKWLAENFPVRDSGLYSPEGFKGLGVDRTFYKMRDMSSLRAVDIAKIIPPKTNLYHLMRMGGADLDHQIFNAIAEDFTLDSPRLGHTNGGLFVGPGSYGVVNRVNINGCQGKMNGPPEETGSLVVWRQKNCTISNVNLDGRNVAGVPVASSLLMLSACENVTVSNLVGSFAQFGFGAAIWRNIGLLRFVNCRFTNSRKAVNIEQAEPGSVFEFVNCYFDKPFGADYLAQVSTRKKGQATVRFIDNVNKDMVKVRVFGPGANATEGGNGMQDSDIRVIEKGVDTTATRLQLVRT